MLTINMEHWFLYIRKKLLGGVQPTSDHGFN